MKCDKIKLKLGIDLEKSGFIHLGESRTILLLAKNPGRWPNKKNGWGERWVKSSVYYLVQSRYDKKGVNFKEIARRNLFFTNNIIDRLKTTYPKSDKIGS